jgi:hypothetical protein
MNYAVAIIGALVLVVSVIGQAKAHARFAPYRRSGFGTRQPRSRWSLLRWPEGRQPWRAELWLWAKIAVFASIAGAIFTLVVTH